MKNVEKNRAQLIIHKKSSKNIKGLRNKRIRDSSSLKVRDNYKTSCLLLYEAS